jgi:hypothetical protein
MGTTTIQPPLKEGRKPLPPAVHEVHHCQRCGAPMFLKPLIQWGHCGSILPLRCFSYGKGDAFYAECVDLNLLARGNTRDEAVVRLQEQMFSYVATVFEGDGTEGLIPRRAPLTSFIRYYLAVLGDRLSRRPHPHHNHTVGELQSLGATTLSHC